MNHELENETALVTGSTAGIGLAIATSLAVKKRLSSSMVVTNKGSERRDQTNSQSVLRCEA